jgi:hypothetical protein
MNICFDTELSHGICFWLHLLLYFVSEKTTQHWLFKLFCEKEGKRELPPFTETCVNC